jgi:chaperone BCS1
MPGSASSFGNALLEVSSSLKTCEYRHFSLLEKRLTASDCVFTRGRTGTPKQSSPPSSTPGAEADATDMVIPSVTRFATPIFDMNPSTVTLSGLLNAIDGVASQEGCILIAST